MGYKKYIVYMYYIFSMQEVIWYINPVGVAHHTLDWI